MTEFVKSRFEIGRILKYYGKISKGILYKFGLLNAQEMSDKLIWYNPESKTYENGSTLDLLEKKNSSTKKDEFNIFMKLSTTSDRMMKELTSKLNNSFTTI